MMSGGEGVITLLSDFGLQDPYVGIMKGVMLGIAPKATLVDLTHGVPPQDVAVGAYQLSTAWPYFPEGSVHMAVVDPGVGGERGVIIVEGGGHYFVGPDNGLLECALALPDRQVYLVGESPYLPKAASHTFHGRDVFSPLAAQLRAGVAPGTLGVPWAEPTRLEQAVVKEEGSALVGVVLAIDAFGNLITNIEGARLAGLDDGRCTISLMKGPAIQGLSRTYIDVPEGAPLALVGSTGRLEISCRGGSAQAHFQASLGDWIRVEF